MASEQAIDKTRRKRIERLKKIIITTVILSILIPIILCIVLLFRVSTLKGELRDLQDRFDALSLELSEKNAEISVQNPEMTTEKADDKISRDEPKQSDEDISFLADELSEELGISESDEKAQTYDELLLAAEQNAERRVYLTFDDGPSSNTERILDVLDTYNVKATFFVNIRESEYDDCYKEIVDRGHTIGMHSATHSYADVYASAEDFAYDLDTIRKFIYEKTGVYSELYRFPGGSSNRVSKTPMKTLAEILAVRNIRYFDWNCMNSDATNVKYTPEELLQNVLDTFPKEGDVVILMHDAKDKDATVEALPLIIETLSDMDGVGFFPITPNTVPVQHEIFK